MSLTSEASRSTPRLYLSHKFSGVPWIGAAPSSATIGCEIGFAAACTSSGSLCHSRADFLSRG